MLGPSYSKQESRLGRDGREVNKEYQDESGPPSHVFETTEDFLAHAVALESEVADRYETMAQAMEVHNNAAVAELFHRLAQASEKHADDMRRRSHGRSLPKMAPWEYRWGGSTGPESPAMRKTHYLMTPYHALELARSAEIRAQQYYEAVAKESPNPEVRTLAIEFAYEEAEHVDLVNAWISRYPKPDPDWDYDPDPPGMPE